MKLYDLPESLRVLDELVDEGAIEDDMLRLALDQLGTSVESKMDGIARLVRNWESEADAVDAEIKRLRGRSESLRNEAKRVRDYALGCLQAANMRKVKLPIVTAYIGSTVSVEVTVEPEALPAEYQRVSVSVDKTALKKALQAGEVVEGAALVSSEYLAMR